MLVMAAFSVCGHLFVILLACVIVAGTARGASTGEDGRCRASCTNEDVCTFEFKVNIFASETGYFEVDGCDGTNPTLVMDANKLYVFSQADESNWMHPIGFGYMPDGALKDNPELEPGVNPYDSSCVSSLTCQHPRYFRDGKFLGSEEDVEDFGLDVYEPEFMFAREMWKEMGTYQVQLTITSSQTEDFFMFCHIHNLMSLRVKIADDGVLRSPDTDTPELGYEYETPTGLDESCGTSMINQYRNFTDVCHGMSFVCDAGDDLFGLCMNALDCAMHIEMASKLTRSNLYVTFLDQMIPHHINAVNMAKATLKLVEDLDEEMIDLQWTIINSQNMQVTFMRQQLEALGLEENERRCEAMHCDDDEHDHDNEKVSVKRVPSGNDGKGGGVPSMRRFRDPKKLYQQLVAQQKAFSARRRNHRVSRLSA
eukprot:CAMPEP_0185845072 /NCGR_PEP_ID=MMETSP1354-20130828/1132_1 /TAXON_ID=708628 /ORGANISM="Erythrolobus madagascarensis, Strain CCMP3276" /LENGTH=424 /DNA_ID=CAMNT_0028544947 /DNA_START=1 /DNA_END=1275 /DNA_ORIENTATION=+